MLNAVIKFYFCGKFSPYFKRINNENTTFKLSFLNIYTILYITIVDLNKRRRYYSNLIFNKKVFYATILYISIVDLNKRRDMTIRRNCVLHCNQFLVYQSVEELGFLFQKFRIYKSKTSMKILK